MRIKSHTTVIQTIEDTKEMSEIRHKKNKLSQISCESLLDNTKRLAAN